MNRVVYQTDQAGETRDQLHFEIDWQGKTVIIEFHNDVIKIIGPCFDVHKDAENSMDIKLRHPHKYTDDWGVKCSELRRIPIGLMGAGMLTSKKSYFKHKAETEALGETVTPWDKLEVYEQ